MKHIKKQYYQVKMDARKREAMDWDPTDLDWSRNGLPDGIPDDPIP